MTSRPAASAALVIALLFGGCNKDYPNPFNSVALAKPLPSGAALVFTSASWSSTAGAGREMFSIGVDGSNPTRITFCNDGPVACDTLEATPAPEGTRAVQRRVKSGTAGVSVVYVDLTRGVEAEVLAATNNVSGIDWAPTADIVAYSGVGAGSLDDLYRMDPNGANVASLTATIDTREINPRIDPATSTVVYENIVTGGKSDVFILSSTPIRVSPAGPGGALLPGTPYLVGSDASPAFSPDETAVVFRRLTAVDASGRGTWDIMTAKIDGTGFATVATGPLFRGAPDWGPSGIVYPEVDAAAGTASLVLIQADGSGRKVLLTGPARFNLSSPRWLRTVVK